MRSRLVALLLIVAGGGLYLWQASAAVGLAPALLGALLGLAAILLASGVTRTVLAVLASALWLTALAAALLGPIAPAPVAAAALGLLAAVLTVVKGRSWPGWSGKYSRAGQAGATDADDPRAMWDSLDRGIDPTHSDDAPRAE